ncbi:MAG: secretin N-terminal domain-containing protein, partial [Chthoniobacteraceae bacterium]
MAKFHTTLCALGAISLSAALAQNPAGSDTPPITPAPPFAPAGGPADGGAIAPAPIDPPITYPAVPPPPVPPQGTATELNVPGDNVGLAPTAGRLNEFQGDDISLVLRTLARQAEMNIVVSDKVAAAAGTVTMRIQDKTPREAIEVIIAAKGLVMDELNGVYFVKTQEERAKEPTISGSYTFNYAAAKDVAPLLQSQLASAAAPQIDSRTNTIYYRETKSNLETIQKFLEDVDSPTKQVMIEARLVEVNANPKQSYGINWAGTVGGFSTPQTFRYGGSLPSGLGSPTTGPLDNTLIRETGNSGVADFLLNGQTTGGFGDTLQNQFAILSIPQMSATLRFLN